ANGIDMEIAPLDQAIAEDRPAFWQELVREQVTHAEKRHDAIIDNRLGLMRAQISCAGRIQQPGIDEMKEGGGKLIGLEQRRNVVIPHSIHWMIFSGEKKF